MGGGLRGLGALAAAGALTLGIALLPPLTVTSAATPVPAAPAVPAVPAGAMPIRAAASTGHSGAAENAPGRAPRGKPACSAGLVALTFDDGPVRRVTPRLVRILVERGVPATFFMVGWRIADAPKAARAVKKAGLQIANHSWNHPQLTRLPNREVRSQLAQTRRQQRLSKLRPGRLMRPPYGSIDNRVAGVVARVGMVPVLWDVDSDDWRGGDPRRIATRVLRQLRPHRSNIVLQHDGVRNSPASVAAVPIIVKKARQRGFCFTDLADDGTMRVPVPEVAARASVRHDGPHREVRVVLRLDRPTSRTVRVRVRGGGGAAAPEDHGRWLDTVVRFTPGQRTSELKVRVTDDPAGAGELHLAVIPRRGLTTSTPRLRVALGRTAASTSTTPPSSMQVFRLASSAAEPRPR